MHRDTHDCGRIQNKGSHSNSNLLLFSCHQKAFKKPFLKSQSATEVYMGGFENSRRVLKIASDIQRGQNRAKGSLRDQKKNKKQSFLPLTTKLMLDEGRKVYREGFELIHSLLKATAPLMLGLVNKHTSQINRFASIVGRSVYEVTLIFHIY